MASKYNISHIESGSVKVNHHVILFGNPCRVNDYTHAKTGKHGHMKVNISATDLITNKNVQWMAMGDKKVHIFNPVRMNYQIINIDNDECLDNNTNIKIIKVASDVILQEINDKIDASEKDIYLDVQYLPIIKNDNDDIDDNIEEYCLICGVKEI
jgi:translation initiation factor 5A